MSATFRYIQTGQTVTFTQQVDIDSMKGHPEYERVEEQEVAPIVTPVVAPKKMGRPSKAEQLAQLEALQ
jgi:ABC-type molybdate transport system substrate-binding protein